MHALDASWPYLAVLGTLFLTGVGLPPLPEEVTVVAAGVAASHSELAWWVAWPICVAGVVAADAALYWAGRVCGEPLLRRRWVMRILPQRRREGLERGLRQHGVKVLVAGRLVPGSRTGVFLLAGALRYPFARFLLVDGLAAAVSVGVVFFGSYFLTASFV